MEVLPDTEQRDDATRLAAAERVKERLASSAAERIATADARRAALEQGAAPSESLDAFLARAEARRAAVTGHLEALAGLQPGAAEAAGHIEGARAVLADSDQDLAASAYFLPKYDARVAAAAASELRDKLAAAEAAAAPKRAFAFSRRAKPAAAPATAVAAAPAAAPAVEAPPAVPSEAPAAAGLRGLQGGVHVLRQEQLGDGEADYALEDLEDCTVFVLGTLRALRLRRLRRCTVVAAAVAGSTFVDVAQGCRLHLAARQVRIHDAEDTDFYLRVRSHPIIEGTTRVRFAPYAFLCPAMEAAQTAAGLGAADKPSWGGSWALVDDFAWLRASQSPNWTLLPEAERTAAPAPPASP